MMDSIRYFHILTLNLACEQTGGFVGGAVVAGSVKLGSRVPDTSWIGYFLWCSYHETKLFLPDPMVSLIQVIYDWTLV